MRRGTNPPVFTLAALCLLGGPLAASPRPEPEDKPAGKEYAARIDPTLRGRIEAFLEGETMRSRRSKAAWTERPYNAQAADPRERACP